MALEAAVYQQDLYGHNGKDIYSLLENWSCDSYSHQVEGEIYPPNHQLNFHASQAHENYYSFPNWDASLLPSDTSNYTLQPELGPNSISSSQESTHDDYLFPAVSNYMTTTAIPNIDNEAALLPFDADPAAGATTTTTEDSSSNSTTPKRRRRARSRKNMEDIENQRMTHIAVERNRRRQMNDYLATLKSIMPDSYVQRGDQASVVGGAINFVKELEHKMQCLSAHNHMDQTYSGSSAAAGGSTSSSSPFEEFFTFPQYKSTTGDMTSNIQNFAPSEDQDGMQSTNQIGYQTGGLADIEVTIVDSHANLKIRSMKRPKQLRKLVAGLQSIRLNVLHLNVSTVDQISLYCISVKVEDDSKLTSADEIATAVYQLLGRIQQGHI